MGEFYFSFFVITFDDAQRALDWLKEISNKCPYHDGLIQLLNPRYVASEKHLEAALYHVFLAFKEHRNITRSKSTEFLVRMAGSSQIKEAFAMLGINEKEKTYLGVISSNIASEFHELKRCIEEKTDNVLWKPNLPLYNNINELMLIYSCRKTNIEEITKKAIEKIAYVEVL